MKKEITIKANEIAGLGIIDGKFTICSDNPEVQWIIFDDETIEMILEFHKLHG